MGAQVRPLGQNGRALVLPRCRKSHRPKIALERQEESRHNLLKAVTAPLEENSVFQALCVLLTTFQLKLSSLNEELRHMLAAYQTIN